MDPKIISQGICPLGVASKEFTQTITFKGSDANYSVQIVAQDVTINCSTGNHHHGSSKVKLSNVVDYNWEQKYYTGHLLAVHVSGKYFAYGIKARNATGKGGGMVRVATQDSRMRALIKEMNGQVQDIAFAHNYNIVQLACVDDDGSLFVYNIVEEGENLICTIMLHILQSDQLMSSTNLHRVVWCPYLPEEEDVDDDACKLLVLTHCNKAELINVGVIHSKYGSGPVSISGLSEGYLEINEHTQPIMDAAFSPDGTAVATASMDGYVKFFQIYMHEGQPRCLHEWQPHCGKPLSCLIFLDNHYIDGTSVNHFSDQFWKFVITGCNNNTELKFWSCENWTCLQTICFKPSITSVSSEIFLKARLDLTAEYLFLSDINNRVMYILEMHKDRKGTLAFARSVSEFLLPAPVLSYGIFEASLRKFRCSNSTEELYPCEDSEDFEQSEFDEIIGVVVRMYVIQPKRLQECQIVFQPDSCKIASISSSPLAKKILYPEEIPCLGTEKILPKSPERNTDLATATSEQMVNQLSQLLQNDMPKLQNFNDLQNLLIQPTQSLNLMTPDAFNSPVKAEATEDSDSPLLIKMASPLPDKINSMESKIESDILNYQRNQKDNFASGGSSPSREVQEILSLNNANYNSHEYYENDKIPEEVPKKVDYDNSNALYNESTNINADGWPSIPILKAKEVVKSEEKNNIGRLVLQDIKATDGLIDRNLMMPDDRNHKETETVQECILTLAQLIRDQSAKLEKLQNEVRALKSNQNNCNTSEDFENIIDKSFDTTFSRIHNQQIKMFDNWANSKTNQDIEHQEAVALNLSHIVSKQVHEKLQNAVNIEMKQTVLPVVVGTFENLKHVLKEDFSQKITATEHSLKETLNKFVNSKDIADSMGNALATNLRPAMENSYRDVIGQAIVPSLDKVCNNLFQQINETFTQGTKEYTIALESHLDKSQKKSQDRSEKVLLQMQTLCDMLRSTSEQVNITLPVELNKQIISSFQNLQEQFILNMSESIKEQVAVAFKYQASVIEDHVMNAVRSRAVTPSPHDTQVQLAQIQALLSQGHVNTAFQQALSASDLSLVVYICERLNPQSIFGQSPCPIQQHVLLSLVQQLSADMHNHTEMKMKYLENAVLNLDPSQPNTKTHMAPVLKELHRQLTVFIATFPNHKCIVPMKMLIMAVRSLLNI